MNRKIRNRSLVLMLLAGAVGWIAAPRIAWGQQVTAAITGVVTDPSGAPIVNANVTAADTLRGTVWATQTNDSGAYNLPRVPIGSYNVKVEANGFQDECLAAAGHTQLRPINIARSRSRTPRSAGIDDSPGSGWGWKTIY